MNLLLIINIILVLGITFLPILFGKKNFANICFSILGLFISLQAISLKVSLIYTFSIPLANFSYFFQNLIHYTLVLFALNYPRKLINKKKSIYTLLFIPTLINIYFMSKEMMIINIESIDKLTYGSGKSFFTIYILTYMIIQLASFVYSYQKSNNKSEKSSINLIAVGILCSLLFALSTNTILPLLKINKFTELGNLASLFALSAISYTMLKYKFIEITPIISKSIAFIFTALLVFLTTLIPIVVYKDFLNVELNFYVLYLLSFTYILLLSEYYSKVRTTLQSSAKRLFLKEAYDVEQVALEITNSFTSCTNFKEAIVNIYNVLDDHMEISNVQVFFPLNYDIKREVTSDYESWSIKDGKPTKDDFVENNKNPIIKQCLSSREIFDNTIKNQAVKNELKKHNFLITLPCYSENELLSIILIGEKDIQEKFNNQDKFIFNTIQKQIPATIIRLNKSLESAAIDIVQTMQIDMLPKELELPKYDISWHFQSAEKVGGDYFDIIQPENENHHYLILGDTVDHGLASGIIALKVRSIVNTVLKNKPNISAKELNYLTNTVLSEELEGVRSRLPVSIVFLKITENEISFSGHHNELFIYRDAKKSIETLDVDQFLMSIGEIVLPLEEFKENTFKLNKNDFLFVYSDGIIEAAKDGISTADPYGEEKTKEILINNASKSTKDIKTTIKDSLDTYTKSTYLDDFCYVILKKK
jgi:hypothetical protein